MASRQSISNFEAMDAVGTSRSSQLGLAGLINQFILRIPPIYRTYLCFRFTFEYFLYYVHLVAQVSSKNFAKVLLLFQIPKDTVFSCVCACTRKNVIYIKNLTFLKIECKGSGFRVVYKIYRPQNKMHPDFEFSECKGTAFI